VQPPRLGRLHSPDLRSRVAQGLSDLGFWWLESRRYLSVDSLPGVRAGLPAARAAPAPTTRVVPVPARTTPAVWVPFALAVPVVPVMWLAVEVEIVVAATPIEVVTPARVPELARAPVIVGERPGIGLSDARRAQTSKSQTCGEGSRGCDSFDVFHLVLVPRKRGRPNISLGDFLMNPYESAWYWLGFSSCSQWC
jgi:hypothetical protein